MIFKTPTGTIETDGHRCWSDDMPGHVAEELITESQKLEALDETLVEMISIAGKSVNRKTAGAVDAEDAEGEIWLRILPLRQTDKWNLPYLSTAIWYASKDLYQPNVSPIPISDETQYYQESYSDLDYLIALLESSKARCIMKLYAKGNSLSKIATIADLSEKQVSNYIYTSKVAMKKFARYTKFK
tara:strand:+ start:788 stop:1345 length:558 start_codon:yes stop_codon:yes gene_type:complete